MEATPQDWLAKVEDGLDDLGLLCPELMVPVDVVSQPGARVAWINRRWFASRGVDLSDPRLRKDVDAWLIDRFAVVIPPIGGALTPSNPGRRLAHADRYGSTSGMSPHGGSGRVVTLGRFQVKGAGATPLVSARAPADYSSGMMSLEEGLREAIYSELVAQEFPGGAVPVIALIDTGLMCPDFEHEGGELPRGLLVRPAVFRAAHIERAPLFLHARQPDAVNQRADAARCRVVVARWRNEHQGDGTAALAAHFRTVAAQMAYAQVHRMSFGGYFTSNVTLDGTLLDFGNMHVFDSWNESRVLVNAPGLGQEQAMVRKAIFSLAQFMTRFDPSRPPVDVRTIVEAFDGAYHTSFDHHLKALFGGHKGGGIPALLADDIATIIRQAFRVQQRKRAVYKFGRIVQGAGVRTTATSKVEEGDDALLFEVVSALMRAQPLATPTLRQQVAETLVRTLAPRRSVDRRRLMDELPGIIARYRTLGHKGGDVLIDEVARIVGDARRV